MANKPTIKDVAKKAGVSIATVSFVLNRRHGQAISEAVAKRVLRAAEQLHYHPNASAAGLARKRTHNVALVFYREPNMISNAFYSAVIQGAVDAAMQAEYNLFFSYVNERYRGHADLPKVIRESNTEGVLFIREVHPGMIADIQALGLPVVTIDQYPPVKAVDTLEIDNRTGGLLAARHLLELGHTNIAMFGAARQRPSIAERAAGFLGELKSIRPRARWIDCRDYSFDAGYQKARELLGRKRRPTALFCANDELAASVLRAAYELDVRVPEELSVVGFDNIEMSRFVHPALTTVRVSKSDLGARAMRRLLELAEGKSNGVRRELVPVELLVRGSTARPPG
ncbi:MAG: LacI family DNA-binding transcriptional regulator [Polyangiaceae bacterium]|nr:LacI family DNA-binding transcriptional regulator [Polyangiaceae bacterium]